MRERRLLVADSHDDCREAFTELLRDLGHLVIARSTFSEVVATLRCEAVDAVILDRWLAGLELPSIGVLANSSPVPVVVLCTHLIGLDQSCLGRAVILPKPLGIKVLISVLAQIERRAI